MNILVAEHEPLIALDLLQILEDAGHTVCLAFDRDTALEIAEWAECAFVNSRLMDGFPGLAMGQMLANVHGLAVFHVTAYPGFEKFDLGAVLGVLPKPFNPEIVEAAVSKAEDYLDARQVRISMR